MTFFQTPSTKYIHVIMFAFPESEALQLHSVSLKQGITDILSYTFTVETGFRRGEADAIEAYVKAYLAQVTSEAVDTYPVHITYEKES